MSRRRPPKSSSRRVSRSVAKSKMDKARRQRPRRRHSIETLEARQMLAADLLSQESNGQISSAQTAGLTPGVNFVISGTVGDGTHSSADVDFYRVDLAHNQVVNIDVDANLTDDGTSLSGLDSQIRIFDSAGNELGSNGDGLSPNDFGSVTPSDSYLSFKAGASGSYFIGISSQFNTTYDPLIPGSGTTTNDPSGSGDYEIELFAEQLAPKITVLDEQGNELTSGSNWNLGSSTQTYDITRDLTIRNDGSASLSIPSSITTSAGIATIQDLAGTVLQPGQSAKLRIRLDDPALSQEPSPPTPTPSADPQVPTITSPTSGEIVYGNTATLDFEPVPGYYGNYALRMQPDNWNGLQAPGFNHDCSVHYFCIVTSNANPVEVPVVPGEHYVWWVHKSGYSSAAAAGFTVEEAFQPSYAEQLTISSDDPSVPAFQLNVTGDVTPIHTTVVNSTGDSGDADLSNGFAWTGQNNSESQWEVTLRAAIQEANQRPGPDRIIFDIPTSDPGYNNGFFTIDVLGSLPEITDQLFIDGLAYTSISSSPVIHLRGKRLVFQAESQLAHNVGRVDGDGWSASTNLDSANWLAFGPFVQDLSAGQYTAKFRMQIDNPFVWNQRVARIDVYDGSRGQVLASQDVYRNQFTAAYTYQDFYLNFASQPNSRLEFRVYWEDRSYLKLDSVEVLSQSRSFGAGLAISASDSIVRGLSVTGFDTHGIIVTGSNNRIESNYVGIDPSGQVKPNLNAGVYIAGTSSNNVVGTNGDGVNDANEGNVLSGNGWHGVLVQFANTTSNTIAGNLIGTDPTGTIAIPNQYQGIELNDSVGNLVGTNADGISDSLEGNLISGNNAYGIGVVNADDNTIAGNLIGVGSDGVTPVPNKSGGIRSVGSSGTVIGTNADDQGDEQEGNTIGGNSGAGIEIDGGSNNIISGNFIGVTEDKTTIIGNVGEGIVLMNGTSGNLIGGMRHWRGFGDNEDNVIAGNAGHGIRITGTGTNDNVIVNNYIGIKNASDVIIPNGGDGIRIENGASRNIVGAKDEEYSTPGKFIGELDNFHRNRISYNIGDAVAVVGAGSIENRISRNITLGNGGQISLDSTSPANDLGDSDTGANQWQNHPTITTWYNNTIYGTLNSTPNTTFYVEIYGEYGTNGDLYFIGYDEVTTDANGYGSFYLYFDYGDSAQSLQALAIDENGNTSVLSPPRYPVKVEDSSWEVMHETELQGTVPVSHPTDSTFTFTVVGGANNGTFTIQPDGSFTYVPDDGFAGIEYVSVEASDGVSYNTGMVTIDVTNELPVFVVGQAPHYTITAGQAVQDRLNMIDPDGDAITFGYLNSAPFKPDHGTLDWPYSGYTSDGTFVYTPDPDFVGTDEFYILYSDGIEYKAALVTVEVVNGAPLVTSTDHDLIVMKNGSTSGQLTAEDPEEGELTFSISSIASHGTVSLTVDPEVPTKVTYNYVPDPESISSDQFTITVTDDLGATTSVTVYVQVNQAPTADADIETVPHDGQLEGVLTGSDPDVADALTFSQLTDPTHGDITSFDPSTGEYTYEPDPGYVGPDSFDFQVSDNRGGTHTATLTIDVTNAAPVVASFDNNLVVLKNQSIEWSFDASDPDDDPLSFTILNDGLYGTAYYDEGDDKYYYSPDTDSIADDQFTVRVTDSVGAFTDFTVYVQVNQAPTADADIETVPHDGQLEGVLTGSDPDVADALTFSQLTDPTHGDITSFDPSTGEYTYEPDPGYVGPDSFDFQVSDNRGGTHTATLTIDVTNAAPVVASFDNNLVVLKNQSIEWSFDASDPDDDPLSFTILNDGLYGTAYYDEGDDKYYYSPDTDSIADDQFTVRVTDSVGAFTDFTVYVQVNQAPTADADIETVPHDGQLEGVLTGSDPDVADALTFSQLTDPTHGDITSFDPSTGEYTYEPDPGYVGPDSFDFQVSDNRGGTHTATLTIDVTNAAPVVASFDNNLVVLKNQSIEWSFDASDPDDDPLSFTILNDGLYGTAYYDEGDDKYYYSPDTDSIADDQFTVRVTDSVGAFTDFTVYVQVNQAPTADADIETVPHDGQLEGVLTGSDPDVADALTFSQLTDPTHGDITSFDPSTGEYTYEPDPGYVGPDSFDFQVSDNRGGTHTATLTIDVTNAAPDVVGASEIVVLKNRTNSVELIAGDLEGDEPLDFTVSSLPLFGATSFEIDPNDSTKVTYTYEPNTDSIADDQFTVRVTDSVGAFTDFTVYVQVDQAKGELLSTVRGEAINETLKTVHGDSSVEFELDPAVSPQNGSITDFDPITGSYTYEPDPGFVGEDSFGFRVKDGLGVISSAVVTIDVQKPIVNLSAPVPTATEGGTPAQFLFSLQGTADTDITINYKLGGVASAAFDIETLSGEVTILAGTSQAVVDVVPIDDVNVESTEDLILTLDSPQDYQIGSDSSKSITIFDNDVAAPQLGLVVELARAYESRTVDVSVQDPGLIRIDLPGVTSEDITVAFTLSGSAIVDDDYVSPGGTVTIEAGTHSAWVVFVPIDDEVDESEEVIVVTLESGSGYALPLTPSENIWIEDLKPTLSVDLGNSSSISEGAPWSRSGTFDDQGVGVNWIGTVDYGDGTAAESVSLTPNGTFDLDHTYLLEGSFTVTVTFESEDHRSVTGEVVVTMTNVLPTFELDPNVVAAEGKTAVIFGQLTDPGQDAWTGTVTFGDSSEEEEVAVLPDKTFFLEHVYSNAGTYAVSVSIDDGSGNVVTQSVTVTVASAPVFDLDSDDSSGANDRNFATTFVESGSDVAVVDSDAYLYDSDSSTIESLTAMITNRWDGDSETLIADTTGTSLTASPVEGGLTLSGKASVSEYEQVLRTIRYLNTSGEPHPEERVIEITAFDGVAVSLTATSRIAITFVNDVPNVNPHSLIAGKNMSTQIYLGDDGDADVEQELELVVTVPPVHGQIYGYDSITRTVWYSPGLDYEGGDSFSYQLNEVGTAEEYYSTAATIDFNVETANQAPIADPQDVSVDEDDSVLIQLTGTDGEEVASQALTFEISVHPLHGTLSSFDPVTGSVLYTPDANFAGEDSFSFRITDDASVGWRAETSQRAVVSIVVEGMNDVPESEDLLIGVLRDQDVVIALGNDGDEEVEQTLVLQVTQEPLHGDLSGFDSVSGEVIYTPDPGYVGIDSFTYVLVDEAGSGISSTEATVSLEINEGATTTDSSVSLLEDGEIEISLIADPGVAATSPLTYYLVSQAEHGEIVEFDDSTGVLMYRPNENYQGSDSFEFRVGYATASGAIVYSAASVVDLAIESVNDAPTSANIHTAIATDTSVVLPLGTDGDEDIQQTLSVDIIESPLNGALTNFDPLTGEMTYTPNPGFEGTDTFSYRLKDDDEAGEQADLEGEIASVTLTVRSAPTTADIDLTINEDESKSVQLSSMAGVQGDLFYEITVYPQHGELIDFNPETGTLTYVPFGDYHGTDSFQYRVLETVDEDYFLSLESHASVVSFTISPLNDPVVGTPKEIALGQDQEIEITLEGYDQDPEVEQVLTYTIVDQPVNGTITGFDPATGILTYTPSLGFYGVDSFTFTVTDNDQVGGTASTSDPITIDLTIGANPTATSQAVSTVEESSVFISLSGAAGDSTLTPSFVYSIVGMPEHGTITDFDSITGTLTYTPDDDFAGIDTFQFLVADQLAAPGLLLASEAVAITIDVSGVNDAPVANSWELVTGEEQSIVFDTGHDGDDDVEQDLHVIIQGMPQNGTLSEFDVSTGYLTYTPDPGFIGTDSFMYAIQDADGLLSSPVTTTVTVVSVNAAPMAINGFDALGEEQSVTFTLVGEDGDIELTQNLRYEIVSAPNHGEILSFDPVTGIGTYIPDSEFAGMDRLYFVVHEEDGAEQLLSSFPGEFVFEVGSINDTPTVNSLSLTLVEDQTISLHLQADDGDENVEQELTFEIVSQPSHGTITGFDSATGAFQYTPDPNYSGSDSFTYHVTDDNAAGGAALTSDIATIELTIVEMDTAPVAAPLAIRTKADQPVSLQLSGHGDDDEVQDLTFTITSQPANGTLSNFNSATGEATYTPNPGHTGIDSFIFSLEDNDTSADPTEQVVLIDTRPIETIETAVDDEFTIRLSDGSITFDVLANDIWSNTGTLSISSVSVPIHGQVTIGVDADGNDVLNYTPAVGQISADTFTYTIDDGSGATSSATVNVNLVMDAALPIGGVVSIGGIGFDAHNESTFQRPVTGTFQTTATQTNPYMKTFTDDEGNEYEGAGDETVSRELSVVDLPNGDWSYTEIVTWSYETTNGDTTNSGGYTYTFFAGSVLGVEFFSLILHSEDSYTQDRDGDGGDGQNGYSRTGSAGATTTADLIQIKSYNQAGGFAFSKYTTNTTSNLSEETEYWNQSEDKTNTGTSYISGSSVDFLTMTATWTELAGVWTAQGNSQGFGFGENSQSFNETGTYSSTGLNDLGQIAGITDASGQQSHNYNYTVSGSLLQDLTWSTIGTGKITETGNIQSSYSGSGDFEREDIELGQDGFTVIGNGNVDGIIREDGQQSNETEKELQISLGETGWFATGGTDKYSSQESSHYETEGSGSYTRSHASVNDGPSWIASGKSNERTSLDFFRGHSGEATFDGTDWSQAGSGEIARDSYDYSDFAGKGTLKQDLLDSDNTKSGTATGIRNETGDGTNRHQSTIITTLLPDGTWSSSGSATHISCRSTYSDFDAKGDYTFNKVNRSMHLSGSNGATTNSTSKYTLDSNGDWLLTEGTKTQDSNVVSHADYSGSGSYGVTKSDKTESGGEKTSRSMVDRTDKGSNDSTTTKSFTSIVVNNNWFLSEASIEASGSSLTDTSNESKGTYSLREGHVVINGTTEGSGHYYLSDDYNSKATWDPNGERPNSSETGIWTMTGDGGGTTHKHNDTEATGTGKYHREVDENRFNMTIDGKVDQGSKSHEYSYREWETNLNTTSINPDIDNSGDAWELVSGSGKNDESNSSNYSMSASGSSTRFIDREGGGIDEMKGTIVTSTANNNSDSFESKSEVVDGEWMLVSGSGSGSGLQTTEETNSGSGNFSVKTGQGTYTGTRFTDNRTFNSFNYDTKSTVSEGDWTTTGSASSQESGHDIQTVSTESRKYTETISSGNGDPISGSLSGSYHKTKSQKTDYEYTGEHTLDFSNPESEEGIWLLTSGSGEVFSGEGEGQSYHVSGRYSGSADSNIAFPSSPGKSESWTIEGEIEESGYENVTVGTTTFYNVFENEWFDYRTADTREEASGEEFSDKASGTYARDYITGEFSRESTSKLSIDYDTDFTKLKEESGIITGIRTGKGTETYSTTNSNSFNASGEVEVEEGKSTKTFNESGRTDNNYDLVEGFEIKNGIDGFVQTSGTITISDFNKADASYELHSSGVELKSESPDGSNWNMTGSQDTVAEEGKFFKLDSERTFDTDAEVYKLTKYSEVSKENFDFSDEYNFEGSYLNKLSYGTMSGTQNASGSFDHTLDLSYTKGLSGGNIKITESNGKETLDRSSNSDYDGTGSYQLGHNLGTMSEDGETHRSSDYTKDFKYVEDKWLAKGSGHSHSSGESNSDFDVSGIYSSVSNGITISGSQSRSGASHSDYDIDADYKLGPESEWILVSGNGDAAYSGSIHSDTSASGKYQTTVGDYGAKLSGNLIVSTNNDATYDGSYDYKVVENEWQITGSGKGKTTTETNLDYGGFGFTIGANAISDGYSYQLGTYSQSGNDSVDTEFNYNWSLTPEGETEYSHLKTTSESEASLSIFEKSYHLTHFEYQSNGLQYKGHESNSDTRTESFHWTEVRNDYVSTDLDGKTEVWSDFSGDASASGKSLIISENGYEEEYFKNGEIATASSGEGITFNDNYDASGTWSGSTAVNGAVHFESDFTNKMSGRQEHISLTTGNVSTTVYKETGEGWGFSSSASDHISTYGFGSFAKSVPYSGYSTSYDMAGEDDPPSSTGGDGSEDPPYVNPLAGGPWFLAGEVEVAGVLVDMEAMLNAGKRSALGMDFMSDTENTTAIPLDRPDLGYSASWLLPKEANEFIGESVRFVVGNEALANASDFELFVGTAAAATAGGIAIFAAAPGFSTAFVVGAAGGAAGGAIGGAAFGAAYYVAAQYDAGEPMTLDGLTSAVGQGAAAGAIAGGLIGGALGVAGAALPATYVCGATKLLALGGAAYGSFNAGSNIAQGNFATAAVDLLGVGLTVYGAKGLGCFVAGTQIVLATEPGADQLLVTSTETDNLSSSNAFPTAALVVGMGLVSLSILPEQRKKKQAKTAREALFSGDWEDELDADESLDRTPLPWEENEEWDELLTTAAESWSEGTAVPVALLDPRKSMPRRKLVERQRLSTEMGAVETKSRLVAPHPNAKSRIRGTGIVIGLALMMVAIISYFQAGSSPPIPAIAAATPTRPATQSIETIQLGQWVRAHNPELTDSEREPSLADEHPANLRVISLQMQKEDGTGLEMDFLRSVDWLEEQEAEAGGQIDIEVAELGASGMADVLSIEPAPQIRPRPSPDAQLITGRYIHAVSKAYDLEVVDENNVLVETIGVTANHPFWSGDQQEFLPVERLVEGEALLSIDGAPVFVGRISTRSLQEPVYNLEVEAEHVYYVGSDGVLAHNAASTNCSSDTPKKSVWQYIKAWHDKRANALFGNGKRSKGRTRKGSKGVRHYDKRYKGKDIEYKSDNFSKGPRKQSSLDRMRKQIEKDVANRKEGVADPHWHFEHDPTIAPEMKPLLKLLKDGKVLWTAGSTTPKL